jgi:ferredoxin
MTAISPVPDFCQDLILEQNRPLPLILFVRMVYQENLPLESQELNQPLPIHSRVTYILDGARETVDILPEGKVLLEAALEAGIDAPWSCRGGVCATCKAKLLSGAVHMKSHHALTQEEIDEGYILTCQSHALTPEVTVDYDV